MKVIKKTESSSIATVYIAENDKGNLIEFVESTQPPRPINEKWVLVISTLYGCPVDCKFCDAGGRYSGKLSTDELFFQVDYAVKDKFPDLFIDTDNFKVQLARMGEPAFNKNVLEFLKLVPERYNYKHFVPSLSSIAPKGTEDFFDELLSIKKELYDSSFQLQFSIHSTDIEQRKKLIPANTWSFKEIADYSERFHSIGGKKISLNFALAKNSVFSTETLLNYFSPEIFLIKLTPLNPTRKSFISGLESLINDFDNHGLIEKLSHAGYDSILSIGENEENYIGSNCGQYVNSACSKDINSDKSYTYELVAV